MSRLLQQTAHLTFLGIFLTKSAIPLTIFITLATIPSTTPKVVKLICISSFGKISRRSYTYHPISALAGYQATVFLTANRLQKGKDSTSTVGFRIVYYTLFVYICQLLYSSRFPLLQKIHLLFPAIWFITIAIHYWRKINGYPKPKGSSPGCR